MIQVYHTFNLDFKDNASVSAVSKAALPAETGTDIESNEDIGKKMYQSFVDQRIKGEVSIWSTMKKRNLNLTHLTYFRTSTGESQRNIGIQSCYEAIGVNHASWVSTS